MGKTVRRRRFRIAGHDGHDVPAPHAGLQSGIRAAQGGCRPAVAKPKRWCVMELTSDSARIDHSLDSPRDTVARKVDWTDGVFLVLLGVGAAFALNVAGGVMDYYEKLILLGAVPVLTWMGWLWRPLRRLMVAAFISCGLAVQIGRAHV